MPPDLTATWTTTATTPTTASSRGRRLLLLPATTRACPDSLLQLLTLGLQYRGAEKRDLLTLVDSAQNLRVVEIADSDPHDTRCVLVILLYEYQLRATPATSAAGTRSAGAASATLGATK